MMTRCVRRPGGSRLLGLAVLLAGVVLLAKGQSAGAAEHAIAAKNEDGAGGGCEKRSLGPSELASGFTPATSSSCVSVDVTLARSGGGMRLEVRGARVDLPCQGTTTRVDGELVVSPDGFPFPITLKVDVGLPCSSFSSPSSASRLGGGAEGEEEEEEASEDAGKITASSSSSPPPVVTMRTRGVKGAAGIAIPNEAFEDEIPPIYVTATFESKRNAWFWSGAVAAEFGPTEDLPVKVKVGVELPMSSSLATGANATAAAAAAAVVGQDDDEDDADVAVTVEIGYEGKSMSFALAGRATLGAASKSAKSSSNAAAAADNDEDDEDDDDTTNDNTTRLGLVGGRRCGATLRGELLLAVDPIASSTSTDAGTVDVLAEGKGDLPPPTSSFKVNATGACEDEAGVTALVITAGDVAGWRVVDDVLKVETGRVRVVVTRARGQSGLGNVTGSVEATVRVGSGGSGASAGEGEGGIPPIFVASPHLTAEFTADLSSGGGGGGAVVVESFTLAGDVKITKGNAADRSSPFVSVVGAASMKFPCFKGERVEADVVLSARAPGHLDVNGMRATLVYHCGVGAVPQETTVATLPLAGARVPVFEVSAAASQSERGVTFVKGLTLDDFGLNFTAFRSWRGDDPRIDDDAAAASVNATLSDGAGRAKASARNLRDATADQRLFGNISAQEKATAEAALGGDDDTFDAKPDPDTKYGLTDIDDDDDDDDDASGASNKNATNSFKRPDSVTWSWDFAGSVRGRISLGGGGDDGDGDGDGDGDDEERGSGATVAFSMNTADGSWKAAAKFEYVSDSVNATLAAGGSSGSTLSCDEGNDNGGGGGDNDRSVMRVRTAGDLRAPEPVNVYGDVSLRLGGGASVLIGRAEGEQLCGAEHEWHVEAVVDEAVVPIGGGVATATLESLVVVLDGYKREEAKKPSERFELNSVLTSPSVTAAAAALGVGNATAATAADDADEEEEEEKKRLDWTAHIEGGGSIVFGSGGGGGCSSGGGRSEEEDAFMNDIVGYVNVTIDAHTDKTGAVVVDEAAVRGELSYASDDDAVKVTGVMDIRLPCGAFPGRPTFEGTAAVDVAVGPLDVSGIEAGVEYFCAPTESHARTLRVWAKMDFVDIGGDVAVTLTDVEIDVTGVALPVSTPPSPVSPPPVAVDLEPGPEPGPEPEPEPEPEPAPEPAPAPAPNPKPAPADAPAPAVAPAPAPAKAPPVVDTADCCNGKSTTTPGVGRQPKTGECCNPKTFRVVPGQQQCTSSRWCKSAGSIPCAVSASIPATKTCLDLDDAAQKATGASRSLLAAAAAAGDNATRTAAAAAARNWTFSGFVKGRMSVDAGGSGGGAHTLEAMYVFDTADGSWSAGVAYSLRMDGVALSLSGRAASPCVADRPTALDGTLELDVSAVQMSSAVTARHWCEPNATAGPSIHTPRFKPPSSLGEALSITTST